MVVETTFIIAGPSSHYFQTAIDAATIANTFKSGKNVVVRLPHSEDTAEYDIFSDMYFRMVGYSEPYSDPDNNTDTPAYFSFAGVGAFGAFSEFDISVLGNGKLAFAIPIYE